VANVKNVDCSVAFVDGVDDPVDVWLTAKKQMAKFLISGMTLPWLGYCSNL
jgi:hypothetical protein